MSNGNWNMTMMNGTIQENIMLNVLHLISFVFEMFLKCLHIDGFVQDCSDSSALAKELLQSCIKLPIYNFTLKWYESVNVYTNFLWLSTKVRHKMTLSPEPFPLICFNWYYGVDKLLHALHSVWINYSSMFHLRWCGSNYFLVDVIMYPCPNPVLVLLNTVNKCAPEQPEDYKLICLTEITTGQGHCMQCTCIHPTPIVSIRPSEHEMVKYTCIFHCFFKHFHSRSMLFFLVRGIHQWQGQWCGTDLLYVRTS